MKFQKSYERFNPVGVAHKNPAVGSWVFATSLFPSYLATISVQLSEEYRYLGSVAGQHGERLTSLSQTAIATMVTLLVCIGRRAAWLVTFVQYYITLCSAIAIPEYFSLLYRHH